MRCQMTILNIPHWCRTVYAHVWQECKEQLTRSHHILNLVRCRHYLWKSIPEVCISERGLVWHKSHLSGFQPVPSSSDVLSVVSGAQLLIGHHRWVQVTKSMEQSANGVMIPVHRLTSGEGGRGKLMRQCVWPSESLQYYEVQGQSWEQRLV